MVYIKGFGVVIKMFDFEGLGTTKHFILIQNPDPLQYCTYSVPIPSPVGLICSPCDLPNQYSLHKSDSQYSEMGDKVLDYEEQVELASRILLPPSHRPWKIVGKDYYNHTPMIGFRDFNICCGSDRPQVRVYYQSKYVGRIVESTVFNCCCLVETYQQFLVYDAQDRLIMMITAPSGQKGQIAILPFCGFDRIVYQIKRVGRFPEEDNLCREEEESGLQLREGPVEGEIVHLFSGFGEYTSKRDKYGITLPRDSTEEENALIVYTTLFIDYLLFQNF